MGNFNYMFTKPFSLRNLIINHFRGSRGFVSYDELKELAEKNGYKVSNLERRMRTEENGSALPIRKYNREFKPIKGSQAALYFKWVGGKTTVFR
jgi:hypothetical protein